MDLGSRPLYYGDERKEGSGLMPLPVPGAAAAAAAAVAVQQQHFAHRHHHDHQHHLRHIDTCGKKKLPRSPTQ
ncbi:hypothetical protein BO71DRAFT_94344 [Aspergillus ellipticus CBS 707.79]|uniref:Uncharacterized protein n=1 Tax=Aspergillus ellipticus CBS 707.79 TaxID=1448320 RepID=A0A319CZ50_9EURO|nr:hypothetical protein BO71DRAFT_94344 [Aspergillus ellipticus CBS 707.79]